MKKSTKEFIDCIFKYANWKQLFIILFWYWFNPDKIKTFRDLLNLGMHFKFAFTLTKI